MSVKVVKDKCEQSPTEMRIVVESTNREEAISLQTRNDVIKYAQQCGFPARGLAGVPTPYPVDAAGKTDEDGDVEQAELALGKRAIAGYRADFKLHAGIGAR
jgi:hypothetical protein